MSFLLNTDTGGGGSGPTFEDSFEDEAADSGVPEDWKTTASPSTVGVTTSRAYDGSQSMEQDGGGLRPAEQPYSTPITSNVEVAMYVTSGNRGDLNLFENETRRVLIRMDGELKYYDGSNWQTISTTPNTDEWLFLRVENVDVSADTYDLYWETANGSGTETGIPAEGGFTDGYDAVDTTTSGLVNYDAMVIQ